MEVSFDKFNDYLLDNMHKPKMVYDFKKDFKTYQKELKAKLIELLCIDKIKENACEVKVEIQTTEIIDNYTKIRFVVETEKNNFVPCVLAYPNTNQEKYKLAIVFQGHGRGMYQSFYEIRVPEDADLKNRAFALQAMDNGYAALAIEMRGRGELQAFQEDRTWENGGACKFPAATALLAGRTLEGERVWDIQRILDIMPMFENIDMKHILITGCSGGGTLSFYAGAIDDRITMSAPDCGFCTYRDSIGQMYHCICNYIPHAYEYFDMPDLTALYVGKTLLIIAGEKDYIFPIDGVREGFKKAQKIFEYAGHKDEVHLLETPREHYWCEDLIWPEINKFFK